ncbi:Gfo/Idh/MocA family protein [Frigidibacter sp. ROC022]|uniref:Gfo/Idh/MocA family protein n=1 Tax=Frigidibacter sp. ROC022 TaxID=2971796 RepID=UPI00215A3989|nr:Gfo/Idh/MocA family oxidoreductase [Frigidibacter sp. ROC022]MCR8723537.1 Gfo/Idh/MocA family oxidoreductase [Frigidibacter sp. ROC022]
MERIGVGLIGTGFMGKCHALAYGAFRTAYDDGPAIDKVTLCDLEAGQAAHLAKAYGFEESTTDWRRLIEDPRIDLISITSPNMLHREMAIAALEAGKHVWCEKPMALTLADAEAMTDAAAARPGQATALGYAYLRNPALQHARQLIESGAIGTPFDFRGSVDEDYMADPDLPWSWRLRAADAGLGTLGDLTVHLLSMARELMGDIDMLTASVETVHRSRPVPGEDRKAEVENDDIAHALVRFRSGARGTLASSRIAHGRKNGLRVEVHGSAGTLWIDNERMNELNLYLARGPAEQRGFRRVLSGPLHPEYAHLCPAPGHGLGFNELKVIELAELVRSILGKPSRCLDFAAGLGIERAAHAFVESSRSGQWVSPG